MKKIFLGFASLMIVLSIVLAGCGSNNTSGGSSEPASADSGKKTPAGNKYLTIATGGTSGVYYILGGAMAKIYNEKLGYNASAQTTSGAVENINLLNAKKVDMILVMSDSMADAEAGKGSWEKTGAIKNMKALGGLYMNYVHVIAPKNKNIKSINDLKGKKIGVGAPNSGTEVNARMVLKGYGLTYDDVKPDYLSFAECVEQLKNGTIDAAFITAGLGVSAVTDLQTAVDVEIVPVEAAEIEKMKADGAAVSAGEIPPGTYKNDKAVPTVAIKNLLAVRDDMPEEQAYDLTKTFYESLKELAAAHNTAEQIIVDEAAKDLVTPLHPGAEKYFKEIGKN
ncbi:TAXI family TRAP transporter solute-binding subunit [Peribacillus saganii]|uniref:TAXI family TRAP transporter solute-binding subunit n=1 Tax=Peribacillus saganii TaxID=2303992 RepID=A0A372LAM2_9BACI|nr:TAXI family TRAP transporter solute-binding subunit [Peribacillus saganii]RFU62785.1 TAXI family TRAP transporter solute-binding subunit [Peribacillus saganii]